MDRVNPRPARRFAIAFLTAAVVATAGCTGPMLTAMYLAGGMDTPAEFKGLNKKKTVVVCRPLVQLKYNDVNVSKLIGHEVGTLLAKHARCNVIAQDKVTEWLDNNTSDDYLEIGRALGAEMVVGIDLLDFNIQQGQTLYQGKARYDLKVVDCKTGAVVFEKSPDPAVWPPNTGIPTSEKQSSQFRRQFVGILAEEIARRFYSHDPRVNFAGDAAALD
jgi:hypothetical protein